MKNFDFKSINAAINKYLSPQGMNDFNRFLESLPLRAGYPVLVAGMIAWLMAGLAIVYATTVATQASEIKQELEKAEALKPIVPKIVREPVSAEAIKSFTASVNPLYKNISITHKGKNTISVSSSSGQYFGAFREAINHAYNGGQRWRLSLQSLCVGRECKGAFLSGSFEVNTLRVQKN